MKTNKFKSNKEKKKDIGSKRLIGIDQPFDYQKVVAVTGPEYVENLKHDGVAFVPYEKLKKNLTCFYL